MFDAAFDPRSSDCRAYRAGDEHRDPSVPLEWRETYRIDLGLTWRTATVACAAAVCLIAAYPSPAAAGAIVAGLLVSAGLLAKGSVAAAVVAFTVNAVLFSALSFGLNQLLAPSGQKPNPGTIDALRNIYRGTAEPAVVVVGEAVLSGLLIEARSVNAEGLAVKDGNIMHVATAVCMGPIESFDRITLNDKSHLIGEYRDHALFATFLGFHDQQPVSGPFYLGNSGPLEIPAQWRAKHRPLSGVAYVWGVLRHSYRVFPSGAPGIRYRVRGLLMWDPREDVSVGGTQRLEDETTWQWSNNPIVAGLHYLLNPLYGRGVPLELIDIDSFIAAANVCDEPLSISVQQQVEARQADVADTAIELPKYRADGVYLTDSRPVDILSALATACNGGFVPYGGKWTAVAGAPRPLATWPDAPSVPSTLRGEVIEIDETHLRTGADFEIVTATGARDKVNVITPIFFNPEKDFQKDSAPAVTDSALIAEDGGVEYRREVEVPFCANVHRARYIARQILIESRMGQRINWPGVPAMLAIPPLARIRVSNALFGLEAKEYVVREIDFDAATREAMFALQEYDEGIYDNPGEPVRLPPRTTLPDPFIVDPPSSVAIVEALHANPDGSRSAKLVVTISPPRRSLYDGFRIDWRSVTEHFDAGRVAIIPSDRRVYEIIGLAEGTYEVQVRSTLGSLLSRAVVVGARITYVTTPPPAPNSLTVSFDPKSGLWEYAARAPGFHPDLVEMEFRLLEATDTDPLGVNLADEWLRAHLLGRVAATGGLFKSATLRTLTPVKPAAYVVYAKSIDTTALYSVGTAWARIAAQPRSSDVIYRREFGEEGWTGGEIIDGMLNDEGCLVARATVSFSAVEGQPGTTTWTDGPSRVVFMSEIIDLGIDRVITYGFDARVNEGTRWRVETRAKSALDLEWPPWRRPQDRRGRYVQFRLTAVNATQRAEVCAFVVEVRDSVEVDFIDNYDMAARLGDTFSRIDDERREHWLMGSHLGTAIVGHTLTLDPDTALACSGTTCAAPHDSALNLAGDAWTIEFEIGFDGYALDQKDVVVVGKGTAWRVLWNDSLGLQFFSLKSTGYTGDNPQGMFFRPTLETDPDPRRPYHIAIARAGNKLRGYVDGRLMAERTMNFTLPTNTAPITIGANLVGTLRNIRIWDHARTQPQISGHMGSIVDPRTAGLVRQWRCSDGTSSLIRDFSPAQSHAEFFSGGWARIGFRAIVPVDLFLVRVLRVVVVGYEATTPTGTSVLVQARIRQRFPYQWPAFVNWQDVAAVGGRVFSFGAGTQQHDGAFLDVRAILRSSNLAHYPVLRRLSVVIGHTNVTGTAVVFAPSRFSHIDHAGITAMEGPTAALAAAPGPPFRKSPYGARFNVRSISGAPINPVIDVLFQGSRIGQA